MGPGQLVRSKHLLSGHNRGMRSHPRRLQAPRSNALEHHVPAGTGSPVSPDPAEIRGTLESVKALVAQARALLKRPITPQPGPISSSAAEANLGQLHLRFHQLRTLGDQLSALLSTPPATDPDRHSRLEDLLATLTDSLTRTRDLALRLQALSPQASDVVAHDLEAPSNIVPLYIPASPVLRAALQAMYAGGPSHRWTQDTYGRPQYLYRTKHGHVTLFLQEPINPDGAPCPPLEVVRGLSVETTDVFLVLMSRIAQLQDPLHDLARIRLQDMARDRGIRLRKGRAWTLHQTYKQQIVRIANLRLTMVWQNYKKRGSTLTFGQPHPDSLLDIVGIEYEIDGETWTGFQYRCGQALAHFLSPTGLRWIGRYSRALLALDPYHEALAKKVGTYWILTGTTAAANGAPPRATPHSILEFCGEEPNWAKPNRTVDRLIQAHQRLVEIGLIQSAPDLEPPDRLRGYFRKWLDTPITVPLSDAICRLPLSLPADSSPGHSARRIRGASSYQRLLPSEPPPAPDTLSADPKLIRLFRTRYNIHQDELARTLGITRESLSRYERGVRKLPPTLASELLALWRKRHDPPPAISADHPLLP